MSRSSTAATVSVYPYLGNLGATKLQSQIRKLQCDDLDIYPPLRLTQGQLSYNGCVLDASSTRHVKPPHCSYGTLENLI